MIVGEINFKDVMLFIIKNLQADKGFAKTLNLKIGKKINVRQPFADIDSVLQRQCPARFLLNTGAHALLHPRLRPKPEIHRLYFEN